MLLRFTRRSPSLARRAFAANPALHNENLVLLETYEKNLQTVKQFLRTAQRMDSNTSQSLAKVNTLLSSYKQAPQTLTTDKKQELKEIMKNCELLYKLTLHEALEVQRRRTQIEQCFVLLNAVKKELTPKLHPQVVEDLSQAEELMDTYHKSPQSMGPQEEDNLKEITVDLKLLLEHLTREQKETRAKLVEECEQKIGKVEQALKQRGLFNEDMQQAFKEAQAELKNGTGHAEKVEDVRKIIAGLDLLCKQHNI